MQIPATSAHTPPTQPAAGGLTAAPKKKADAAVQDFLDYAHMTPAQKMRASILKSMGMTEDDLKGMTP